MAAWIQEVNFRATDVYRSDDSSDAHSETSTTANYPETSAQGNDLGWETATALNNEEYHNDASGVDVRLAGSIWNDGSDTEVYRIDLPNTGIYRIRVAFGDHEFTSGGDLEIFDNTTSRATMTNSTALHVISDIAGSDYSEANWPGSNSWSADLTFNSTICRFEWLENSADGWGIIHITIEEVAPVIDQKTYRFYDDGTESGSTALEAADTNITIAPLTTFQLRVGAQNSGSTYSGVRQLQYRPTSTGDWIDVENE